MVYVRASQPNGFLEVSLKTVGSLAAWRWTLVLHHDWWRLLTAGFLHANPMHLALNCLVLKVIGDRVEKGGGPLLLCAVFLSTSAMGFAVHVLRSENPSIGASAGICGLLGLVLWWTLQGSPRPEVAEEMKRWAFLSGALVLLIFAGGLFATNVSASAHAGGFLMGLVSGAVLQGLGAEINFASAFLPREAGAPPVKPEHPFPRYNGPPEA